MTTSTKHKKRETGQTPSALVSWSILGLVIVLIGLSVGFFGQEVAEGPLQVSMTLATLFALGVAYRYNFRGSLISEAISGSLKSAIGTVFVMIAIGTLIGTPYLDCNIGDGACLLSSDR